MTAPARKRPVTPSSEDCYDGTRRTGKIIHNDRGFEAFDAAGKYLATFPTRTEATRAIFDASRKGGTP